MSSSCCSAKAIRNNAQNADNRRDFRPVRRHDCLSSPSALNCVRLIGCVETSLPGRRSGHSADAVAGERAPRPYCVHYTGRSLRRKPIMRRSGIDRADNRAPGKRHQRRNTKRRLAHLRLDARPVERCSAGPRLNLSKRDLINALRLDNSI